MKRKTSKHASSILIPAYIASLAGDGLQDKVVHRKISNIELNANTVSGKILYHGIQLIVSKSRKGPNRKWKATGINAYKVIRKSNPVNKRRHH